MGASPDNIKDLLAKILSGSAREQDINQIVRIAYHYVLTRLKQLVHLRKLHIQSFQISMEGIAFDCLAELFHRSDDGQFVELIDYFSEENSLDRLTPTEVQHHFEIIVFRKLQDGIFRLYRENDPVFSKILRNIKFTVSRDTRFIRFERFGQTFIATRHEPDRNMHLPEYPMDELEQQVRTRVTEFRSRTLLYVIIEVLNDQDMYRRTYSIIDLALIIKRIMINKKMTMNDLVSPEDDVIAMDIRTVVDRTIEKVLRDVQKRYVLSGKLEERLFDHYSKAIRDMMVDTFVHNNGTDQSQHEYLREYIKSLTVEEYRRVHRTQFEYIVRISKKMMKDELKDMLL